jgi:diguanylate cyclase (GGDEF)-like protein
MAFSYALNTIFGSVLVLVLIFLDYYRKFNTDVFQRGIFLKILVLDCIAMLSDFVYLSLRGRTGQAMHVLFIVTGTAHFFFQVAGFCYKYVLLDFIAFKDRERIKKTVSIAWGIIIVNGIFLVVNFFKGYYFTVSPDNFYVRGSWFFIRMIIVYIPAVITAADILLFSENRKKPQAYLWVVFLVLIGAGSALDVLLQSRTNLVWPCVAVSMLSAYFFIIRADLRIDPLTGLENRQSFIEFLSRAGRRKPGRLCAVAMIDMENFHAINETLGRQEGDRALMDMACLIKSCIDESGFAARCGNDKFVAALKSEEDLSRFMGRLDEAAALHNRDAGRPYKIEMNRVSDTCVAGPGVAAEFLAHIESLMNGVTNKGRRHSEG